jgi:CheY-like chemotaxis protein
MTQSILLLEDSDDDAVLLKRAFSRAGLENPVYVVKSVDLAIGYLSGQGPFSDREKYPLPAVVLVDLILPERSGFELLEWIRLQPELKGFSWSL